MLPVAVAESRTVLPPLWQGSPDWETVMEERASSASGSGWFCLPAQSSPVKALLLLLLLRLWGQQRQRREPGGSEGWAVM